MKSRPILVLVRSHATTVDAENLSLSSPLRICLSQSHRLALSHSSALPNRFVLVLCGRKITFLMGFSAFSLLPLQLVVFLST